MHKPTSQRKLKEIAAKHGISLATANEIVRSQWSYLKELIMSSDRSTEYYPVMSFQHLGKFVVTEKRKWSIKNKVKKEVE